MMVKYVRGGRDGVQRILTQEEAEAEDRFNLKLAAAIILAVVVAVGIYVLLGGNVDSPLKKGALVLGSVIALFIGGRFYAWFWGIVGSVALLGLAGTVIYLVGRWILT